MTVRYGIYLTFDAQAEQSLQALRKKLATEIPTLPSVASKMAPHLTLLVFADPASPDIMAKFKETVNGMKAYSIALQGIGAFTGRRRSVLYVKPLLSDELKNSYLRCLNHFSDSGIVPHYRNPAHWHPHVTLSKNLDSNALHQAKAIAEREWVPMTAYASFIGLINVQKPLEVLASKALDH